MAPPTGTAVAAAAADAAPDTAARPHAATGAHPTPLEDAAPAAPPLPTAGHASLAVARRGGAAGGPLALATASPAATASPPAAPAGRRAATMPGCGGTHRRHAAFPTPPTRSYDCASLAGACKRRGVGAPPAVAAAAAAVEA